MALISLQLQRQQKTQLLNKLILDAVCMFHFACGINCSKHLLNSVLYPLAMLLSEYELKINKAAQGMISYPEITSWFESLNEEQQIKVRAELNYCVFQAHPTSQEIEVAIQKSGLKPTFTPCVVFMSNHINEALQKNLRLPNDEWLKSFRLTLEILAVADERRRKTQCANGCTHDWHNIPVV